MSPSALWLIMAVAWLIIGMITGEAIHITNSIVSAVGASILERLDK